MSFSFLSTYFALWALVLFQTLIILGLLRELSEIRRLAEDGRLPQRLPLGARGPHLRGSDLRTGTTFDSSLLSGRELVVLFLSPGCRLCWRLADGTRKLAAEPFLSRIAVCHGSAGECAKFVETLAGDVPVLLDPSGAISAGYGVRSTPVAFVLDPAGRVRASGSPRHAGELAELIQQARESLIPEDERAPVRA
ncbi:MAG TPA: redoxin domain-containing protein [Thermoanaerobaculia bacterium]|nr:redoxin domain-containing protein [Thermoanaerobaculia bacterium]